MEDLSHTQRVIIFSSFARVYLERLIHNKVPFCFSQAPQNVYIPFIAEKRWDQQAWQEDYLPSYHRPSVDFCFSKPRVPETIWHVFERNPNLSGGMDIKGENFDSRENRRQPWSFLAHLDNSFLEELELWLLLSVLSFKINIRQVTYFKTFRNLGKNYKQIPVSPHLVTLAKQDLHHWSVLPFPPPTLRDTGSHICSPGWPGTLNPPASVSPAARISHVHHIQLQVFDSCTVSWYSSIPIPLAGCWPSEDLLLPVLPWILSGKWFILCKRKLTARHWMTSTAVNPCETYPILLER